MKRHLRMVLLTGVLLALALCFGAGLAQAPRPASWSAASHGNDVPPHYAIVLPAGRVNEITLVFRAEDWQAALANMADIYGPHGQWTAGLGIMKDFICASREEDAAAADGDDPTMGGAEFWRKLNWYAVAAALGLEIQPFLDALSPNPEWQPVEIRFGNQVWPEVGFRFKGNSSLNFGWSHGRFDLPFKLDFDEFEDQHLELKNQRFHGFKQLSFANNFQDPSLMREKITSDILRAAGVPAAKTAYYRVYLDGGAGAQYLGLYTAVELPDDTLIESQFASDEGNMYKPSGPGANFVAGSFDERGFDKETNRNSGYEDVLALFAALHATTRLSDPATWRTELESVFFVDGFLRWLATNQLLVNWDSYGNGFAHNYYLYADEARGGALTWIPWDHNLALTDNLAQQLGDTFAALCPDGTRQDWGTPTSLSLDEVDENWPLVRFLLDDAVYAARYRELVAEITAGPASVESATALLDAAMGLLTETLTATGQGETLAGVRTGREQLQAHFEARARAAAEFLASKEE